MRLRHILVVEGSNEDFETVQDAARHREMLNPIVRASSGSECLRLLQLWRDGPRHHDTLPLLVLLDLNTPGDDGRDVLRQVRSDELLGALPLVVLSASANPRDVHFCYAHGANAYHVKPVAHAMHLKVLHEIFDYWLGSAVLPA
jgi:CheY-like chemotaxis protein